MLGVLERVHRCCFLFHPCVVLGAVACGCSQEANRGKANQAVFRRPVAVGVARVPDALPRLAEGTPLKLPVMTLLKPKGKSEDSRFIKAHQNIINELLTSEAATEGVGPAASLFTTESKLSGIQLKFRVREPCTWCSLDILSPSLVVLCTSLTRKFVHLTPCLRSGRSLVTHGELIPPLFLAPSVLSLVASSASSARSDN